MIACAIFRMMSLDRYITVVSPRRETEVDARQIHKEAYETSVSEQVYNIMVFTGRPPDLCNYMD